MMLAILYLLLIVSLVAWLERPEKLSNNMLFLRTNPAEELEEWLKKFHWGQKGEVGKSIELPRYKFYTEVVEILLTLARKIGGNYQDSLLFLRAGLQSDRQFEKKLRDIVLGTWLQMGLMMLLTWAFILGSLHMVEVKVSFLKLALIFGWQMIGLAFLPLLLKKFRERYFGDVGRLWRMLYILHSLVKVPLSRSEVLTMAGVQELKHIRQKSLFPIVEKLKDVCQRALQRGGSYEEEVKGLMEELRFQERWHFELFEKRLMVVKLCLLSLFFLPSYLAFIFLLLGDLMRLM